MAGFVPAIHVFGAIHTNTIEGC